jgi:hypothetical protein
MAFFPQLLSAYRAELNVPIVHGACCVVPVIAEWKTNDRSYG